MHDIDVELEGGVPKAPPLTAPDLLAAFYASDAGSSDKGAQAPMDFEHLAFLGHGLVTFAVAASLADRTPPLSVNALWDLQNTYMSGDQCLGKWADLYDGFSHLKHGQPRTEEARATVFAAYTGAIYLQDGLKPVEAWITSLIKYEEASKPTESQGSLNGASLHTTASLSSAGPSETVLGKRPKEEDAVEESSPNKRARTSTPGAASEVEVVATAIQTDEEPPTAPEPQPPAPAPATQPGPSSAPALESFIPVNDPTPVNPPSTIALPKGKKWLSVLNEGCAKAKNGSLPSWKLDQTGLLHQSQWRATLTVLKLNVSTLGIAANKQAAKEEAARAACTQLGWPNWPM